MIMSFSRKFLFVKTRKTAGTSLEVFLSGFCGGEDVVTPIRPVEKGRCPRNADGYYNHMSAREISDRIGLQAYRSLLSFCVERNPWEKTVSHFYMVKARARQDLDFGRYLDDGEFPTDFDKYSIHGRVVVNRVLCYETLDEELTEVFQRLAVPFPGHLGIYAKSNYRSRRIPYQRYYNSRQVDIVAQRFEREIDLLGYVFE